MTTQAQDDTATEGPRWSVHLWMNFETAEDPVDAARQFIQSVNKIGLSNFTFTVRDHQSDSEEGFDSFFVEDDESFTSDQFQERLTEEADKDAAAASG